jgi:hypothetical protein
VVGWPTLEAGLRARQLETQTTAAPAGPSTVQGTWQGNFGDAHHPGTLVLTDSSGQVAGNLVIDLDGNELRSPLQGTYDAAELVLAGAVGSGTSLTCTVDAFDVCRGQFVWGRKVLPFGLVRTATTRRAPLRP